MAISSRGAERMSSMQSLSACMLIGLHFLNMNMNLAKMNLFTNLLLRIQRVILPMHASCTAACILSMHLCTAPGKDVSLMETLWDIWNGGLPKILLFHYLFSWHSKYFIAQSSEANRACSFGTDSDHALEARSKWLSCLTYHKRF